MPEYKYNEKNYIDAVQKYLDGTYGEHYVANDIQVVDIWQSLESLETTARDTAIKYLCRYGKKGGKNRKDLYKAIHYIVLMMYATDKASADRSYIPDKKVNDKLFSKPSNKAGDAYDEVQRYDTHSREL